MTIFRILTHKFRRQNTLASGLVIKQSARLSLVTFLFLLFSSFNAQCMLKNIKGTYTILNDDYKHFSLVHGAVAWETLIRNTYDVGQISPVYKEEHNRKMIKEYTDLENTHKTVQLVHALFYRVPGSTSDTDFGETKLLKTDDLLQVAKIAAQILALIHTLRQDDGRVHTVLDDVRKASDEQLTALQKNIPQDFDTMDQRTRSIFMKNASNDIKQSLKKRSDIKKQLDFINKFEQEPVLKSNYENLSKGLIIKNFEVIESFYNNLLKLQNLFKDLLAQNPLDLAKPSLAQIVFDSLQECDPNNKDALYPQYTPETIVLAFVYKKCSHDRTVLKVFYEELDRLLSSKPGMVCSQGIKGFSTKESSQQNASCVNKVLACQLDDQWVKDSFDDIDQNMALEALKSIFNEKDERIVAQKIDEILYCTQQVRSIPAPIGYSLAVYEYDQDKKTKAFPDCMCNTMRNLINILSYDMEKNCFDLNVLKKRLNIQHDLNPKLEAFYKNFGSVNKAASSKAHDEWIKVISSIPYLAYIKSPEQIDQENNPINAKKAGYIIIPSSERTHGTLKQFLDDKGYQALDERQHGYELMPCVRNTIIVLNHLLNLNLFEKAEHGLAGEFSRNDFVKTYFPALCKRLNLKENDYYLATTKEAQKETDKVIFDSLDFEPYEVYATFIFSGDGIKTLLCTCKLMTKSCRHGELSIQEQGSKSLIELIQTYSKKKHQASIRLIFTSILSREFMGFNDLIGCDSQEKFLNIFTVPLTNTGLLTSLIDNIFSKGGFSGNIFRKDGFLDDTLLQFKIVIRDLLFRLADKQADEMERKRKKLSIADKFCLALEIKNLNDDEQKMAFSVVLELAKMGSIDTDSEIRYSALMLYENLANANYQVPFKQILEIVKKNFNGIDDLKPNNLLKNKILALLFILVEKDYKEAFELALDVALEYVNEHFVRSEALLLWKRLIEKGDQKAFKEALNILDIAEKDIKKENREIDVKSLELFQSMVKMNYKEVFKRALQAAERGIKNNDKLVQKAAASLYKSMIEKDYQESFTVIAVQASSILNAYIWERKGVPDIVIALLKKGHHEGLSQKACEKVAEMASSELARRNIAPDVFESSIMHLDVLKIIIPHKVQELINSLLLSNVLSEETKNRLIEIRDASELYNDDNEFRCPLF